MKKILMPLVMVLILVSVVWVAIGEMEPAQQRWYSLEQVQKGEILYREHCSSCHGRTAGGATITWRTRNADGSMPPPPLDGSAHTWRRPLSFLRQTIRVGGAPMGGVMPPFGDKLTAGEIDATIAWFQSLWAVDIYSSWSERGHETR